MIVGKPREGIDAGFHILPNEILAFTLGDPEKIIWASLRNLCAREVAYETLFSIHNIRSKRLLKKISRNIKTYINHAYEFYRAATGAESNAAPLIFYYSFLNLAKAICEINQPGFHKFPESYRHGISWRPNKDYLVDLKTEEVAITTRGIWHVLNDAMLEQKASYPNPCLMKIKELFAFSSDTSIEYGGAFNVPLRLINLINAAIYIDRNANELWMRFSVDKENLKKLRITRPKLINLISRQGFTYEQVESNDKDLWTFESKPDIKFIPEGKIVNYKYVKPLIQPLNLFVNMGGRELEYSFPLQDKLSIRMSQLTILYSLIFWLGSLVRYDPHSVEDLRESRYWILINGFMNQSRIWLLELFEWYFYKTDTTLLFSR